jgi:hypothetical protein
MLGAGDAPAAPLTLGGRPHPAATTVSITKDFRNLFRYGIIPNTWRRSVMLALSKVLCDAELHYIWRFAFNSLISNDEV